jgi:hypothetical protein
MHPLHRTSVIAFFWFEGSSHGLDLYIQSFLFHQLAWTRIHGNLLVLVQIHQLTQFKMLGTRICVDESESCEQALAVEDSDYAQE